MNTIEPGDYEINLIAQLPSQIPSSFYFSEESKKNRNAPKIKLGYYAQATIRCANTEFNLSHRQVLMIREKPEKLETFKKLSDDANFKTWCCCSQGSSILDSVFNKNVFKP